MKFLMLISLSTWATLASSQTTSNHVQALRGATPRQLANIQEFKRPQVKGMNVDYCLHYNVTVNSAGREVWRSSDCGLPAADVYCKSQNFDHADPRGFDVTYYSHSGTYVQGDDRVYPEDENQSHGSHTYFHKITCISDQ